MNNYLKTNNKRTGDRHKALRNNKDTWPGKYVSIQHNPCVDWKQDPAHDWTKAIHVQ